MLDASCILPELLPATCSTGARAASELSFLHEVMKYITTQVWTDIPPLKLEPPILIRGFTNVSDGEYSRQVIILFSLVQSVFNWTDNILDKF